MHNANRNNAKRHNSNRHHANIISGRRKELSMRESRTTRAFVSFGQRSEKMVFERAIPSSSTQNVLAQYLRRILTELLRQEENGFESDYVSFRLEQLIDVLLRAESICPQSTQIVSILRRALAITEICSEI